MKYLLLFLAIIFTSCNWAKQKTKDTVNKTGEVVAKTGSEFVNGVSKGIEKTFQNDVVLSGDLQSKDLRQARSSFMAPTVRLTIFYLPI
jgi:hypothetical protein